MCDSSANVFGSDRKIMRNLIVIATLAGLFVASSNITYANTRGEIRAALNKPIIRGGIVFKNYCSVCHGETGIGTRRASRLYGNKILRINQENKAVFEKVIRLGGALVGKSPFMPPWEEELSDEQITDVVAYLNIVPETGVRGEVVFKTNCILCHGIKADGKGRAAKLYDPPPADLTHSDKNDDYKESIIRYGGKAMGRSEVMPIWGEQLSNQEIKDVVFYLGTVLEK